MAQRNLAVLGYPQPVSIGAAMVQQAERPGNGRAVDRRIPAPDARQPAHLKSARALRSRWLTKHDHQQQNDEWREDER
jgi:hypothetical protein